MARSLVVVTPVGAHFLGCGGDDGDDGDGSGAPDPVREGSNIIYTSNEDTTSHQHMLTIAVGNFKEPPKTDLTRETAATMGHSHQVTLTPAQLRAVDGGDEIVVETTNVGSHFHRFTIRKVEA